MSNKNREYGMTSEAFHMITDNVFDALAKELGMVEGTEAYKRAKSSPKVKKVLEKLNDVYLSSTNIKSDTMKTAVGILDGLDPKTASIDVPLNDMELLDSRNVLTLSGKTTKNNDIQDVIREKVEKTNRDLMINAPGGIYRHIVLCRRNQFINRRFPLMKKSNSLFVDDMNNGSYRGGDFRYNPFKVFKNGLAITDQHELSKIYNILNPQSQTNITADTIPFKTLQHQSDVEFRQNGSCYIRTIPLRDVCKRLYIKYILAQKKKKDIDTINAKIAVETSYLIKDVDAFYEAGLEDESIKMYNTIDKSIIDPYLDKISNKSYMLIDRYYLETENGERTPISKHDAKELQIGLETFEQFAIRFLQGDSQKITHIPSNAGPMGLHATMNIAGIPQKYVTDLLNDLFNRSPQDKVSIGIESATEKVNKFGSYLTDDERNLLLNTSFDSIYNIYVDDLPTLAGFNDYVGTESVMLQTGRSSLEDIYLKCLRMESIGDDISTIGTEAISNTDTLRQLMDINHDITAGLESEYDKLMGYSSGTELMSAGISDASQPIVQPQNIDEQANKFQRQKQTKRLEKEIAERRQLFNKLDKLFGTINGEVTYIMDATRGVPMHGGRRFLGYFDTEYTHHDVSYLVTMRTVMGNPINFSSNLDMLDLNKEEYEEVMGRLVFSDTIKPIIEANMSTKFIKDNSENAYTLLKLMEENEISNQMSFQDLTRFSMYNLARVTFVPPNEIIVKRNGFEGMGESLYENVTIPAMAWIIINESMYAYYLVDAKGISFLVVPKGINPNSNVYGQSTVEDVVRSLNVTRSDINDMGAYNFGLTHKIVTLYKDEDAQGGDIQLQTIEYPDFKFNDTFVSTLEQQATGGVGYNSAMYTSKDGTNVELAKKLFEMNDTEALEIMKYQELKQKADSQLATRLLRLRGGDKYQEYTVIVTPPDVSRGNRNKKTEILNEVLETLKAKVAIIEEVYKGDKQVETSMKAIKLNIIKSLNTQDLDINDLEELIERSIRETSTEIATIAKEQVQAVGNPTGIGNDYEEENQSLFGEEEF